MTQTTTTKPAALSLPVWTDSQACHGGRHCATCRDSGPNGVAWRNYSARAWAFPPSDGSPAGFACPYGVEADCKDCDPKWRKPPERAAAATRALTPEEQLEAQGLTPDIARTLAKAGSCCDRPRPLSPAE